MVDTQAGKQTSGGPSEGAGERQQEIRLFVELRVLDVECAIGLHVPRVDLFAVRNEDEARWKRE